ncbi:hypothetical protein DMN91_007159 [Ooceraea biroi]|uniref:Uncharacterized protein n=1 Tax=Ooceraea biroi TaxID=2015173 RepID=A0A3L8DL38_OOCBI|nr:uncharacterized protein LOC105284363 [Ooceraea biroi]RLU20548.1 hypothetical protein DMN91_007159 [Ooceraea biroi]
MGFYHHIVFHYALCDETDYMNKMDLVQIERTIYAGTLMEIKLSHAIDAWTVSEMKIKEFINIRNSRWIRIERKNQREYVDYLWGDTEEQRKLTEKDVRFYDDIFDLRKLFHMESYDVEEIW